MSPAFICVLCGKCQEWRVWDLNVLRNKCENPEKMAQVPNVKTEDMWTPYKELQDVIELNLTKFQHVPTAEFELLLRKYKQNFFSLLQNPQKNQKSRDDLKKGMTEGIAVRGIGQQILSKDLYQEAIIISDMYDLNEYMALDLLCTAQIQLSHHPGLTRGLVAVLLYYDGRKALVTSLRLLVQARRGVHWQTELSDAMNKFITDYTDHLKDNGLFGRILELINNLDVSKEMELLQQNRALGGPKHQTQVLELFQDIKQQLADIIYIWSAQSGLTAEPLGALVNHLRVTKIQEESAGGIDSVSLALEMALLYAMDLSILHTREDGEDLVKDLPIVAKSSIVECLLAELSPSSKWECEGLHALNCLAFGVTLAMRRLLPHSSEHQSVIEQEDVFADTAIQRNVFEFLNHTLMKNEACHKEEFYFRRIHNLLADFIVFMHSRVKDMRIRADETARTTQAYAQQGLEPPANLPRHFEQFLLVIAKTYKKDVHKLNLSLEYWCPSESSLPSPHRFPSRSVSLFKFICLAGDMVPPSLFVPYVSMLASLANGQQAARECFNLLKQNGPGNSNTVSWDHFFLSLNRYYTSLRQEAPPVADTVYRHRNYLKGITPHEVQGMHSVLDLVRTVAENDDFSRLALCEHPGWAPLGVLIGLVSCSVPIPLKGALLSALAALSRSPETAAQMWNNLEASQIVVTVPTTSSYQPRGVQTELEEIESRLEEYPLTRALLKLFDTLADTGVPRTLGAGPRKPGFDPYLTFIVNSVFLKFPCRSYKDPGEKWLVAKLCLRLFVKFLQHYEPQPSDFLSANQVNEFNPPPGFHLMLQLNSKMEFLNLILGILDDSCRLFDTFTPFPGKAQLEECSLLCLQLLNRALQLQVQFFKLAANTNYPVLLTSLTKLLLGINCRTGKPDHALKLCKFVGYQSFLPKHAVLAAKLMGYVTRQPASHAQLMNILLSSSEVQTDLRHGFVECLEAAEDSEDTVAAKDEILALLKQCLAHNAPNLAHFLFGFDLKRGVARTVFQFPGVLNFPRTCLHSLFAVLNDYLGAPAASSAQTAVCEKAYSVLHCLCANVKTCLPVLRFVRLNQDFFERHLLCASLEKNPADYNRLAWLLKTIAIEFKVSAVGNQVFYLKHLTKLLVGLPEVAESKDSQTYDESEVDYSEPASNDKRNLLLNLVKNFDFDTELVDKVRWEFFDSGQLENLMHCCETGSDPRLIDIKQLHRALIEELGTLKGTAAVSQRQLILQEIQKVLNHALQLNNLRRHSAGKVHFMEAWQQVAGVLFTITPLDVVSSEDRQILILKLLEVLLVKAVRARMLPQVGDLVSGAVLLLLDALKKAHFTARKRRRMAPEEHDVDFADSVVGTNATSLKMVLQHIVEWVLVSEVAAQKLRINLYASLVNFLQLVSAPREAEEEAVERSQLYVSRLDCSRSLASEEGKLKVSMQVLTVFGEKLIEVLCHDCIGGHDVCKMLAMSVFNMLVVLNMQKSWVLFMSGHGYLKHLIDSLLADDEELRRMLDPTPNNLRPLYMYEAKMALLIRIADTRVGAELLLEQKVLSCLANMGVFDYYPTSRRGIAPPALSTSSGLGLDEFIPSVEMRYREVLFPALHLCDALLTSLGTDNKSAVVQVLYFVFSHLETVEVVLRDGAPAMSAACLQELALVTGLVARSTSCDLALYLDSNDNSAKLCRLQKLMLCLLPRFVMGEALLREAAAATAVGEVEDKSTASKVVHCMQIVSNLLMYSRNLVANNGVDHSSVAAVFQPSLQDPSNSCKGGQYALYYEHSPTLGVVVQHLVSLVQYYHKEKATVDFLRRRVASVPSMNSVDLKEFLPAFEHSLGGFNVVLVREEALRCLTAKLNTKVEEMSRCAFAIENSLYLIWTHLDYYMLKALPNVTACLGAVIPTAEKLLMPSKEATWKITVEDISTLKQGLVSIFNDTFSRQLVETTQERSESDKGFVEALLRRTKRLIQFVPVK